jgi:hypothetical protein
VLEPAGLAEKGDVSDWIAERERAPGRREKGRGPAQGCDRLRGREDVTCSAVLALNDAHAMTGLATAAAVRPTGGQRSASPGKHEAGHDKS